MGHYTLRQLVSTVPVLIGVSILVFAIMRLIPGDPVKVFYGLEISDPALQALKREELGLNQPLWVQYGRFIGGILQGDWGNSIQTSRPVLPDLLSRLRNTAELAVLSVVLATALGIGMGVLSAVKPYSWLDNLSLALSLAGISMPVFWIGLLLMWLFAVQWGLLPAMGRGDWTHLVLPSLTMCGPTLALVARVTRASILEVIHKDYVRTAHSKGLSQGAVMFRHVLPNALLSTVTVVGLQFGYLLAGAVLTESVFAWPGLGRMIVDSIKTRDYPVVQAGVLLIALIFVVINLLVDFLYGVLDPRVRTGATR